jgi:hypothetical protein
MMMTGIAIRVVGTGAKVAIQGLTLIQPTMTKMMTMKVQGTTEVPTKSG